VPLGCHAPLETLNWEYPKAIFNQSPEALFATALIFGLKDPKKNLYAKGIGESLLLFFTLEKSDRIFPCVRQPINLPLSCDLVF